MKQVIGLFFVFMLILSAIPSHASNLLFENSDFEKGDLSNWTATGDAFQFQPLKGDVIAVRTRNLISNHQGHYWIGTFDKCTDYAKAPSREIQGDRPTGTLMSVAFEVKGDTIRFLLGGGLYNQSKGIYVALEVDGKEVLKTPKGRSRESMEFVTWDVSKFKGKLARIVIHDDYDKGWGHINVDDFHYVDSVEDEVTKAAQTASPEKPAATEPVSQAAVGESAAPESPRRELKGRKEKTAAPKDSAQENLAKVPHRDYPEALAAIVPLYPGATILHNFSKGEEYLLIMACDGDVKDAAGDFYREKVPTSGWDKVDEGDSGPNHVLEFRKDKYVFGVSIGFINKVTRIQLRLKSR